MGVSAFMESCLWPSVLHGELKGETSDGSCSVGLLCLPVSIIVGCEAGVFIAHYRGSEGTRGVSSGLVIALLC